MLGDRDWQKVKACMDTISSVHNLWDAPYELTLLRNPWDPRLKNAYEVFHARGFSNDDYGAYLTGIYCHLIAREEEILFEHIKASYEGDDDAARRRAREISSSWNPVGSTGSTVWKRANILNVRQMQEILPPIPTAPLTPTFVAVADPSSE
jgi:hypothetical protein